MGDPIKRPRWKVTVAHVDIIGPEFWENHQHILREDRKFTHGFVKKFGINRMLPPCNWIVVHIHACQFDQFSTIHSFDKPNDETALRLMNKSASLMMEQYADIVFGYGFNNEHSFVFHEKTELYQRQESLILSSCSSYFTSLYMTKWKEFFPYTQLMQTPHFEAEALCYPKLKILCEYLSWRQAECHAGNQYNTCFWVLVKSGKSEKEAHELLKGTLAKDKNELLFQQFQMNYNNEPAMFRKGSCIYRRKAEELLRDKGSHNGTTRERWDVKVDHVDLALLHSDQSQVVHKVHH